MRQRFPFWMVAVFCSAASFLAYGPRSVTSSGQVVKWALPVSIDLECDLDVRGMEVASLVEEGVNTWVNLSESALTIALQRLGADLDADNVCCFLYDSSACPDGPIDDGRNPIVIDNDGMIVAKFFGTSNRFVTLGFAAVVAHDADTGVAVKGEAVFNAACLAGVELEGCSELGLSFSQDDFVSFIVHEMGHFLGLNHSQVNVDEAKDNDTSNDDKITTMYPFFIPGNGANFKTPERDDQAGLAFLYPADSFSSTTFSISGTVKDDDGTTEFACANVIARNSDATLARTDAISFVSGQLCPGGRFDGSCDGNYQILGLNPSQSYTITVEPIDSTFRSSSGIPPCEGLGQQPSFDEQTRTGTVNNSAGNTTAGLDFTLANTSGNVNNSLQLPTIDIPPLEGDNEEAILAIEAKTATKGCPKVTAATCSSGGGGGCSLLPKR